MVLFKNKLFKKIIATLLIAILLTFFFISPYANASKIKLEEGEFYYSGTTKGTYVLKQGFFSWLLSKIGEIVDFLLGIMTMGGRMVFIGWTTIFENILTSTLEASTGTSFNIDDVNATSVEANTASSGNVTIEAIVYNQVPLFNINIFDSKEFFGCVTGTGAYFVKCETCAAKQLADNPNEFNPEGYCRMRDCDCAECKSVLSEMGYDLSVVTTIKNSVKNWYYVIRYLCVAIMLIVLIFVGIRMALSTVSQDKALYKRMLVDWVVGMIIIFTLHYAMIFIIYLNESMLTMLKKVEINSTSQIVKKEFNVPKMRNEDLEISIYEAVRSRAYDPKLINGTTGTIMYMTLVYYAVVFSFLYFKRYLVSIVLTLLAPGVGIAYALQKVMSGKSKALGQWFQEYFINVFIQTIHALFYTSFVSTALAISLNSVSGMIVAFVFINFMRNAESIFRKIFKLTGDANLSGGTSLENTDPKSVKSKLSENLGTVAGFAGASFAIAKYSPVTKVAKGIGTEALLGVSKLDNKFFGGRRKDYLQEKEASRQSKLENIEQTLDGLLSRRLRNKNYEEWKNERVDDNYINAKGKEAIGEQINELQNQLLIEYQNEEDPQKAKEIERKLQELDILSMQYANAMRMSVKEKRKRAINRVIGFDNYFEKYEKNGKIKYRRKYGIKKYYDDYKKDKSLKNFVKFTAKVVRGEKVFDDNGNKVKMTMGKMLAENFKMENVLGMSKDQTQIIKDAASLGVSTLVGIGSMFVGLGTIVASPTLGMSLLSTGFMSQIRFFNEIGAFDPNKDFNIDELRVKYGKQSQSYKFNRFGSNAIRNMSQISNQVVQRVQDQVVVRNVKKNHKRLYKAIKLGGTALTAIGTIAAATSGAPVALFTAGVGVSAHLIAKNMVKFAGHSSNSIIARAERIDRAEALKNAMHSEGMIARQEKREYKSNNENIVELFNEGITQEEQQEQVQARIDAGDAVRTQDGTIVRLDSSELKDEQSIILDSVAEVLVGIASTKKITEDTVKENRNEIKKQIELKLSAIGINKEARNISEIDKKIDKNAKIVISQIEENREDTTSSTQSDSTSSTEDTNTNTNNSNNSNTSNETEQSQQIENQKTNNPSIVDQVLLKQAIREEIASSGVKEISELSIESVMSSIQEKKRKIVSAQATEETTKELQELKKKIENREAMVAGRGDSLSQASFDQLEEWKNDYKNKQKKHFDEKAKISDETKQLMQKKLQKIKNKDTVVSENETKIDQITDMLKRVATSPNDSEDLKQDLDAMISEICRNTEQEDAVRKQVATVRRMKSTNASSKTLKRQMERVRPSSTKDITDMSFGGEVKVSDGSKRERSLIDIIKLIEESAEEED